MCVSLCGWRFDFFLKEKYIDFFIFVFVQMIDLNGLYFFHIKQDRIFRGYWVLFIGSNDFAIFFNI